MVTGMGAALRKGAGKAQAARSSVEVLQGTPEADTLDEAGRYARLDGGDGNDTYIVGRAGVTVTEWYHGGAGGIDTVRASVSFVLPGEVERLVLTGAGAIDGTGNVKANQLYGNDAANVLRGLDGNDLIEGRAGDDTIEGGAGADRLFGGDGDDTLSGGVGANVVVGGDGNDTYRVDSIADRITEWRHDGLGGLDQIVASVSFTVPLWVELLWLTGVNDIDATGNEQVNIMAGNAGRNVMAGLGGDDTYYVGKGDTVVEQADGGFDTMIYTGVFAEGQVDVVPLPEHVEALIVEQVAGVLIGNALDNQLVALTYGSTLIGGTGADRMAGTAEADTYYVDDILDIVVDEGGPAARDLVYSSISYALPTSIERLQLLNRGQGYFDAGDGTGDDLAGTGNALDNDLIGNAGNNLLEGRGGDDALTGMGGADTFLLSAPGENGLDSIADFTGGEDRIGLYAWNYGLVDDALAPERFQLGTQATGSEGTFVYDATTRILSWDADGAGASAAVDLIRFAADSGPTQVSDFVFL